MNYDSGMDDLENRSDIERLVIAFSGAAFADPLIGPVFTEVANLDLDYHLPNALRVHVALIARRLAGHSGSAFETPPQRSATHSDVHHAPQYLALG